MERYNKNIMKKYFFILYILLFGGLTCVAQSQEQPQAQNANSLMELNDNIKSLAGENQKLEREHTVLEDQFNKLQASVDQEKQTVSQIQEKSSQAKQLEKDQEIVLQKYQGGIKKLGDDLLIQRSRNAYLKAEFLDLDEKQHLRKLQLEDLQYQKKQLEMDWKLKNFAWQEAKARQDKELDVLKRTLKDSAGKLKNLQGQLHTIEQDSAFYPHNIEQLKNANQDLAAQMAELETKTAIQEKENAILKNKKMLMSRATEGQIFPKEQEKAQLKGQVSHLEDELNTLNKNVEDALASQTNIRKLTDELIKVDSQNQALREKIPKLKEQIEAIKDSSNN